MRAILWPHQGDKVSELERVQALPAKLEKIGALLAKLLERMDSFERHLEYYESRQEMEREYWVEN